MLKVAAWPVFLSGTLRAIIRADIQYIPTEKRSVRGVFFKLAWVQITLLVLYLATLARVARVRIFVTEESRLELTSEAVWGMVAFATLPVAMSLGAMYAAWQSSRVPAHDDPWDSVSISSTKASK